jgi:Beta-propeller repeat
MVTKYDAAGTSVWTTEVIGDPGGETNLNGIVADAAGNSYAVGYTSGSPSGPTDTFVTKLDPLGNVVWKTRYTGSPTTDFGNAVALDHAGNVYVAGATFGDSAGGKDTAFLAKLDSAAGNILWIRQFGGTDAADIGAAAYGVGVDALGNAYVGGTVTVFISELFGQQLDVFLAKYDPDGNQGWIQQFGTPDAEAVASVAVDAAGHAWISGSTAGSLPGHTNLGPGAQDAFLAKFDSAGTLLWTQQYGTSASESGGGVTVDAGGNAYVTGSTAGDFGGTNAGGDDVYVVKIDPDGNVTTPMGGIAGH